MKPGGHSRRTASACEASLCTADGRSRQFSWRDDEVEWRSIEDDREIVLRVDDVVALHDAAVHGKTTAFRLVAYVLEKGKRTRHEFVVDADDSAQTRRVRERLETAMRGTTPPHRPQQAAMKTRRLCVLLNPFSGQRLAVGRWQTIVQPLFDEIGVTYDMRQTERAGHAVEIVRSLNLDDYVGIALLSGDGLVSEVLHGLLTRADRDRALRFPILHLPCGTSNALGAAVCYASREPFSPRDVFCRELALMAAGAACVFRPLNLLHVETAHNGHFAGFMTTAYGLIADIDLGSERFRWAGMIRLHIEALIRLARLPSVARYRCKISFKPLNDPIALRNTLLNVRDVAQQLGTAYFSVDGVTPLDDQQLEEQTRLVGQPRTVADAFADSHIVTSPPRLADPVPDDWITIESEFTTICLSSLSHLGSDLPYVPCCRLEESPFYLTMVDWRTLKSRLHMTHLLLTVDRCDHLKHSCLHILPVTACRVEPTPNAGGYFAIDGEPCRSDSAFQAISTSLSATLMSRQPR